MEHEVIYTQFEVIMEFNSKKSTDAVDGVEHQNHSLFQVLLFSYSYEIFINITIIIVMVDRHRKKSMQCVEWQCLGGDRHLVSKEISFMIWNAIWGLKLNFILKSKVYFMTITLTSYVPTNNFLTFLQNSRESKLLGKNLVGNFPQNYFTPY